MVKKTLVCSVVAIILMTTLTGCKKRTEYFPNAPEDVTFSEPFVVELPAESSYAEKRKFIDINCDGIEDMLEVRDTKIWSQEYEATVFLGEKNKDGYLQFTSNGMYSFKLPMEKSWASTMTKIDSADVNGDGCGDLVFTEYKAGFSEDTYIAKIALNQGDGKTFKFATEQITETIPLEEVILRFIDLFDTSSQEDLASYFTMDWSDANGDGRDDLHLFWKSNRDLYGSVLLSMDVEHALSEFAFGNEREFILNNFLVSRNGGTYTVRRLDTEDFNGDGIGDLILHSNSGTRIDLSPALGKIDGDSLNYTVNKMSSGTGADLDFFSFEKIDTFDVNFDSCADYVHLGVLETKGKKNKSVGVYKLASCNN
ncbi:hypothetical protein FMO003_23460 [Moritella sp. F3]|nr:hypothetical protein FMO001_23790 [Moritella sp. F1]GIC82065.1 hypothetical protein FMO003_23460 [Moritella sp. F3]